MNKKYQKKILRNIKVHISKSKTYIPIYYNYILFCSIESKSCSEYLFEYQIEIVVTWKMAKASFEGSRHEKDAWDR